MYQRLNEETKQTRFLELLPGDYNDDIICNFQLASVDDPIQYEALSYVWGPQEDKVTIVVDTNHFQVSTQLDKIIRSLRDKTRSRLFWIDAICINQADKEERASQVSFMRDVFHNACCVTAWLGNGDPTSDKAMDCVRHYIGLRGTELEQREKIMMDFVKYSTTADERSALITTIEANPYFQRGWIIQEIIVAKEIIIQIGSKTALWNAVIEVLITIVTLDERRYRTVALVPNNDDRKILNVWWRLAQYRNLRSRKELGKVPIYCLISRFKGHECTNPSDRIYSWLGLTEHWRATDFKIDYTLHHHDTYKSFVRAMIEYQQSLNWLALAGSPRTFKTLPSWVPDFDLPIPAYSQPLLMEEDLYSADKNSEFSAKFSSSNSLFCMGMQIGKIYSITPMTSLMTQIVRFVPGRDMNIFPMDTEFRHEVASNYAGKPKPREAFR